MNDRRTSTSEDDQNLQRLIQLAKAGDEDALGELLAVFRDELRLQSQQDLRGGMGARLDASDIVQRTCLSAVMHIQDFRGDSPREFLGWLRQIQRRNLVDEVRKHTGAGKRDATRDVAVDGIPSRSPHTTPDSSPSRLLIRNEESGSLQAAVERLPEMQALVVRLKHFDGLRLKEISERIGRSEQAVAGLLRRAVKRLREELEKKT